MKKLTLYGLALHVLAVTGLNAYADTINNGSLAGTISPIHKIMTHYPGASAQSKSSDSISELIKYYVTLEGQDDTCGFKDRTGRIITPAIYTHCGEFYDGMAYVTHGYDTIGYVDTQGKIAIPVIHPIFFDFIPERRNFSEGRVAVYKDDKWGFMDKQGKLVIAAVYRYVGDFSGGLATVSKEGGFGAINPTGDTVIDFRYLQLGDFKEGLANFSLTDEQKVGYMNTKSETVITPTWDAALDFSEGLAAVGVASNDKLKWGFIDHAGRVVIKPKYDAVSPDAGDLSLYTDVRDGYFINGLATMYLEDDKITQVIIDKQGNEIKRHVYDSYDKFFDNSRF